MGMEGLGGRAMEGREGNKEEDNHTDKRIFSLGEKTRSSGLQFSFEIVSAMFCLILFHVTP
jgi:hypothetical protein